MNREEFIPTPEQKEKILGAELYEIEQLLFACSFKFENTNINNALLESTLIHVRALLDFFEKPERATRRAGNKLVELDDVLATDFNFNARKIQFQSQDRERLNKDLAHLTYSRVDRSQDDKLWDYMQVVLPILHRSREFLEHLIGNWIREDDVISIRACKNFIREIDKLLYGII